VAGLAHESNSFSAQPTRVPDFLPLVVAREAEAFAREALQSSTTVSGFVEAARELDLDVVPGVLLDATPAGPVERATFETLTGRLLDDLAHLRPDGVYLSLHGAMVVEGLPSGDAELVRRVRATVGAKVPIVVTHDFHANITDEIVATSDALVTYKENPHIDTKACGRKAAALMAGILRGTVRPTQALYKPPMLYNIGFQQTRALPLLPIVEETRRLETEPGLLAASVAGGYQYADVPQMGPGVVVLTDGDRARAEREARRLGDLLWATRRQTIPAFPDATAAVEAALAHARPPVVLLDMGDNVGGGAAADGTFLLHELMRRGASGWVVVLADPAAVSAAVAAGVGQSLAVDVGGKTDGLHGAPARVAGRVRSLHDGRFVDPEVRHLGASSYDMGRTAVIEESSSTPELPSLIVLTTRRAPPYSLEQLVSLGIHPERQRVLVVKGVVAPRAAYEPIAGSLIAVDTPGATSVDPRRLPYTTVRRPLFGLDRLDD
jgi:microcystin degradation protein MlrC